MTRTVGEDRSLVEDSERSCSGFRGGERLNRRGGEGIISVCIDHSVIKSDCCCTSSETSRSIVEIFY